MEDLEKKPRKVVEIVTPLENQSVKYGEPLELSVKGKRDELLNVECRTICINKEMARFARLFPILGMVFCGPVKG